MRSRRRELYDACRFERQRCLQRVAGDVFHQQPARQHRIDRPNRSQDRQPVDFVIVREENRSGESAKLDSLDGILPRVDPANRDDRRSKARLELVAPSGRIAGNGVGDEDRGRSRVRE